MHGYQVGSPAAGEDSRLNVAGVVQSALKHGSEWAISSLVVLLVFPSVSLTCL